MRRNLISQSISAYQESQLPKLVAALFHDRENVSAESASDIFVVTSSQASEGVTTVSTLISRELARNVKRKTLLISTADMRLLIAEDLTQSELRWTKSPTYNYWQVILSERAPSRDSLWDTDPRFVRDVFALFRSQFDTIMVDCGSLLTSHDFSKIGHLSDGAIIVVQANRSTKQQIQRALQLVTFTGCNVKGFVINRQTYPIPERIYRWLRS